MLTRDMILAAQDFAKTPVEVPEWGGTVYIREMSGKALDDIQIRFMRLDDATRSTNGTAKRDVAALLDLRIAMISYCLCDESGTLLFNDDEGRALLAEKNGRVLERLYEKAMDMNKLSDEAMDEEKKDFALTPDTDSNSPSASPSAARSKN